MRPYDGTGKGSQLSSKVSLPEFLSRDSNQRSHCRRNPAHLLKFAKALFIVVALVLRGMFGYDLLL